MAEERQILLLQIDFTDCNALRCDDNCIQCRYNWTEPLKWLKVAKKCHTVAAKIKMALKLIALRYEYFNSFFMENENFIIFYCTDTQM